MLTSQQQDKKLVKQYKKTNKILRKQLESLNQQIDELILQKSNRIGLQKLPKVEKQLTDVKIIHFEVQNLKKRLEHIKHDNEEYKKKIVVDWIQRYKELQKILELRISQKQQIMIKIKAYERRLKQQKSQVNLKREEEKILTKIQGANNELARVKKIERDLNTMISFQKSQQNKKAEYLAQLQNQQQELLKKSKLGVNKKMQEPLNNVQKGGMSDMQWERLKKDFLELKQSKQQQEMFLYEQNDRLRKQIKFLNQQLKIKKTRIDVVRKYNTIDPNEKKPVSRLDKLNQRNTIDASQSRKKRGFSNAEQVKHQSVRYRDRNNSLNYN